MTEMELLSLGASACSLPNAFAEWRYTGRYRPAELLPSNERCE